jgi:hypothetical protein
MAELAMLPGPTIPHLSVILSSSCLIQMIDEVLPLERLNEGIDRLQPGQVRGPVVLQVHA